MMEALTVLLFPIAQFAALFVAGWICWRMNPEKKD